MHEKGAPEFLSVSLRTHVLRDAVKRSADLLAAIEAGERNVLEQTQNASLSDAQIKAMLQNMVRKAVVDMIARQESDAPAVASDEYLDAITTETRRIQDAQRKRDWSIATDFAGEIARQNGLSAEAVETPMVARQILSLMRQLNDLSARVEREFEDPLHAGRDLLLRHDLSPTSEALAAPMHLSDAIAEACEEAPSEVEKKIRTVGKVAEAFFGDVPVPSITLEQSFEFLHTMWMLPKY